MRSRSSLAAKSFPLGAGIELSVVDAKVIASGVREMDVINRVAAVADAVGSPSSSNDFLTSAKDFSAWLKASERGESLRCFIMLPLSEAVGFNNISVAVRAGVATSDTVGVSFGGLLEAGQVIDSILERRIGEEELSSDLEGAEFNDGWLVHFLRSRFDRLGGFDVS